MTAMTVTTGGEADELRAIAARERGTLVLPDTDAMVAAAVRTARDEPLPPIPAFWWAFVAMGLLVMDAAAVPLLGWSSLDWLPFEPFEYFGVACLAACLSCLASTVLQANGVRRIRVEQARSLALLRVANARTHGYVLSDGGLVELTLGHDGPVRHEHPASEVSDVVARVEDPDHVTLLVRTRGGSIEIPWVTRSDAVVGMMSAPRAA